MTNAAYRGVIRGGMVVLLDKDTPLKDGTEVLVTPVSEPRGSPARVVAAVESAPHVPAEWVDELEQLIAQGRCPPARPDPVLDQLGGEESR